MRIAIKFAYGGKKFQGYVRQPNMKTVEGELIKNLTQQGFIEDAKNSCFRSASRTDRGVSALGNVVAFNTDSSKEHIFQTLISEITDILVYGIKIVEPNFYPRYAKWRIYRYYLKNGNSKLEKILSTVALFTGEHNFHNFARVEADKNPIRIIDTILVTEQDDFFIIDFYAQTFLWHQIRRIVSALEKVIIGKLEKEQIIDALANPEKKVDFGLAPAEPLILRDIIYDFEFEYDKKLLSRLSLLEKNVVSSLLNKYE
jgi:tRNA pseudouridine38-40 synthase